MNFLKVGLLVGDPSNVAPIIPYSGQINYPVRKAIVQIE
jgi:hypothetical protein